MLWLHDATKKENDFLGMCVHMCEWQRTQKKILKVNTIICWFATNTRWKLKPTFYTTVEMGIIGILEFKKVFHSVKVPCIMLPKRGLGCACMVNGKHLSIL